MSSPFEDIGLPVVTRICLTEATAPQISFFVPCLNEEKNVAGALDNIRAAIAELPVPYEILVVDDCSSDNTLSVVEHYMAEHRDAPIVLIKNEQHQGLGRNFAAASRMAKGKYYMLVNGDNVERRELIVAILEQLGKADIIIPYFGRLDARPLGRRVVSLTYTFVVNRLSGNRVNYYNGAVAHLRENVIAYHPGTRGFGHQAELITQLLSRGATYVEMEVPMAERQHGKSSAFKWDNFISVAGSLHRIFQNRLTVRKGSPE